MGFGPPGGDAEVHAALRLAAGAGRDDLRAARAREGSYAVGGRDG